MKRRNVKIIKSEMIKAGKQKLKINRKTKVEKQKRRPKQKR